MKKHIFFGTRTKIAVLGLSLGIAVFAFAISCNHGNNTNNTNNTTQRNTQATGPLPVTFDPTLDTLNLTVFTVSGTNAKPGKIPLALGGGAKQK